MAHIQLIYGDEPQLIEEEKRKFLEENDLRDKTTFQKELLFYTE